MREQAVFSDLLLLRLRSTAGANRSVYCLPVHVYGWSKAVFYCLKKLIASFVSMFACGGWSDGRTYSPLSRRIVVTSPPPFDNH